MSTVAAKLSPAQHAVALGRIVARTEAAEHFCRRHGTETDRCRPTRCDGPDEVLVSPHDDDMDALPSELRSIALRARNDERRVMAAEARDDDLRARGEG